MCPVALAQYNFFHTVIALGVLTCHFPCSLIVEQKKPHLVNINRPTLINKEKLDESSNELQCITSWPHAAFELHFPCRVYSQDCSVT